MNTTPTECAGETVRTSSVSAVLLVPLTRIRTSFAALRQGRVGLLDRRVALADQPLRVVEDGDGYEVVDGFKRLERWRSEGAAHVPVVVEEAQGVQQAKRLLLVSNAPRRTLSVLDETRVVASLRSDGLGPKTIARLLDRKPDWVVRRLALDGRLAPGVERKVDAGLVGPTLAHALIGLAFDDQVAVVACAKRHRLKAGQAVVLVSTLRATQAGKKQRQLLDDPRGLFS